MGTHLARQLIEQDHHPILIFRSANDQYQNYEWRSNVEFVGASVSNESALFDVFAVCGVVAYLAGINLERGT